MFEEFLLSEYKPSSRLRKFPFTSVYIMTPCLHCGFSITYPCVSDKSIQKCTMCKKVWYSPITNELFKKFEYKM